LIVSNLSRLLVPCLLLVACAPAPSTDPTVVDPHTFSRPADVIVTHMVLELDVDFERKVLAGSVSLSIDNLSGANELWLDTRDLDIESVTLQPGDRPTKYHLGENVEYLGQALTIDIDEEVRSVEIAYASRPEAMALQWLGPEQTSDGQHPFLLSQSQAILARSWIPCQDTPAVRMTYEATLRVPPGLVALMSAENPTGPAADGVYRFNMPQPIPAYLLAIAVGDVEFRALSDNAGVWAEPSVVDRAAWEFEDTPRMMQVAEALYGPYRWGRYDLIVLPASFPFGGMENPRLTFVTPTLLAGDRSLVATVAHELAHSWSGNLVTNATWNDFWLNEGFTSYFELRIMEELFGRPYSEMLAALSRQALVDEIAELDVRDTHLMLDLAGRDPDDGMSAISYDKGYLFLRMLEESVGRERWDRFVRDYFDRNAFRSMTTDGFVRQLRAEFDDEALQIDAWVYGPGLPGNAPRIEPTAFVPVDEQLRLLDGGTPASELDTEGWTTHEWLHFVRGLPDGIGQERLAELDLALELSERGNAEVLFAWLIVAIDHRYTPAYPALQRFLGSMGRLKFVEPLYERLVQTDQRDRALEIYRGARSGYHPLGVESVDKRLGWPPD